MAGAVTESKQSPKVVALSLPSSFHSSAFGDQFNTLCLLVKPSKISAIPFNPRSRSQFEHQPVRRPHSRCPAPPSPPLLSTLRPVGVFPDPTHSRPFLSPQARCPWPICDLQNFTILLQRVLPSVVRPSSPAAPFHTNQPLNNPHNVDIHCCSPSISLSNRSTSAHVFTRALRG